MTVSKELWRYYPVPNVLVKVLGGVQKEDFLQKANAKKIFPSSSY